MAPSPRSTFEAALFCILIPIALSADLVAAPETKRRTPKKLPTVLPPEFESNVITTRDLLPPDLLALAPKGLPQRQNFAALCAM